MKSLVAMMLIVLSVSVLMISGCASTKPKGENWKGLGSNVDGSWFYDATSITRPSKDVVGVWVKLVWTDNGRTGNVKKYGDSFRTLDHTLALLEIHCVDKRLRTLSQYSYSTNGDRLRSIDNENATWGFIPSGSVMDALHKIVCR